MLVTRTRENKKNAMLFVVFNCVSSDKTNKRKDNCDINHFQSVYVCVDCRGRLDSSVDIV